MSAFVCWIDFLLIRDFFQALLEVKVGASIGTDSSESERLQLKASLHGNHAFSWD